MKFDINDYKGKYGMHCKTEEEAKSFCEYLDSIGRTWQDGTRYTEKTSFHIYNSRTTYTFNEGAFCYYDWHNKHGYEILEWGDFMSENFTKSNLKSGDVVKFRNERIGIVCELYDTKTIITNDNWVNFDHISEDLTELYNNKEYDIVAVRRPHNPSDCRFGIFEDERGTLIYEREEIKEMTIEEACAALEKLFNEKIKIVEG